MYKTTNSAPKMPTANIAVNKSRIKIYNRAGEMPTCYLQKGQEFQIELFNPTTEVVLAKIELNGRLISQSGLVMNPGERVFLDRYIDVAQKFLFDTYEVSASEEVKEAIKNNGDLKVYFYKEYIKPVTNYPYRPILINEPWKDWSQPYHYYGSSGSISSNSSLGLRKSVFTTNSLNSTGSAGLGTLTTTNLNTDTTVNTDSLMDYTSGGGEGAAFYSSTVGIGDLSLDMKSLSDEVFDDKILRKRSLSKKSKSIETGRVEIGSASDQKFKYVNKEFNSWAFHTVEYKLLPVSQKTITIDELQVKRYCTNCGSKFGRTDKFCSNCGTKI